MQVFVGRRALMRLAILFSRAQRGIDAPEVTIEVFLSGGLPTFSIVGMPETAVRESKDRVRAALLSSGFSFPQERITVSLGPADMRKTGGRFDLAIALGILAASRQVADNAFTQHEFFGELGLNGELRRVPGVLPAALAATAAARRLVVPAGNADEAALGCDGVLAAASLLEVTAHLGGTQPITPRPKRSPLPVERNGPDLSDVRGQAHAKKALEIAAAGGHNLLFVGPPGTGKSMLAQRLPGLLPPMTEDEALAAAAVRSVIGADISAGEWHRRPFRAPHHTASAAALVGGGSEPRPGEVSRAHHGVLFLDELPEFNRHVLDVLREPLEAGHITISRAGAQARFPASFQLVAAMNPCPCGYLGDARATCHCSTDRVRNYQARLSGPLLDRIDIQVPVSRPSAAVLGADGPDGEASDAVAARVAGARRRQIERQGVCNARLEGDRLQRACRLESAARQLLTRATEAHVLSARAYQRMQRVALTVADLAGRDGVSATDMALALSLRGLALDRSAVH